MARKIESVESSAGERELPAPEARPETPAGHVRLIARLDVGCGGVTFEGVSYTVGEDGTITVPEHAVPHILPHGFTQLHEA